MLDPLPEPVVMMKPQPSEAADPTEILSFKPTDGSSSPDGEQKKAAGGDGDDSSSGGGGGGDGGDKDKKTDEELARELHEKLNT